MTDTFKRFYKGTPDQNAAAVYTVPAATTAIIRHIRCVNVDTAAHPITLYDSGTTPSDQITPTVNLQPGEMLELDPFLCLSASQYLAAKSDATTKVTVTAYGMEIGP